jgi:phage terminase large subunit
MPDRHIRELEYGEDRAERMGYTKRWRDVKWKPKAKSPEELQESDGIAWQPHPGPQTKALQRTEFEVLYGGARGGGKTDAGIAWLIREVHNPQFRALVIRRNADDLRDWTDRANQLYSKLGAKMTGKPPEFHWSSGAIIRTGHLKDEAAYTKYQGHEYHRMLIEEVNQIPSERAYLRLIASCRSTVKGLDARVFLTTNPGGIGHAWVKARFIDIAPWGTPYEYTEEIFGRKFSRSRVFIHAKIDDNPSLIENDPNYILTLEQLKYTDPELYRAWRFGDWDVFVGQVFREFDRSKHVIEHVLPKTNLNHFIGIDWGYQGKEAHEGAFACVALCLYRENFKGKEFNRVVQYREWYGKGKTPDLWAQDIYDKSHVKKYDDGVGDASMFNPQSDGSKPISDIMHETWDKLNHDKYWLRLKQGTRNRVSRVATLHNWLSLAPDGLPYLLITEDNIHTVRTLPALIYDESKVEDVDTEGEDHLYDALTYILSQVQFVGDLGRVEHGEEEKTPIFKPGEALSLEMFEKAKKEKLKDWRV